MENQVYGRNDPGDAVARQIRFDWAIRQYRLGLMDMKEAALAARVPVTGFASAVELEVTRPLPGRPVPAPAQRGWEAARPTWTAPLRLPVTAEART